MMLYPAMNKLTQYIPNRYMMVNVVARRARQIAIEAQRHDEPLDEKPVPLAINGWPRAASTPSPSTPPSPTRRDLTGGIAMPQIAKVAVAAATYAIDKPYDYLIPQGTDIAVGMRVLAPFGRGNRVSEGVVLALGQGVPDKPIKPIRSVVDREPVITDREIRLALWMRERYFCTFYDAIRTILPAAVWYSYREMCP